MVGVFSVHGSDEQIFGVKEQILGPDRTTNGRRPARGGPPDAQVVAGTVLGIVSMFANGRRW
jgi:hypothetical protein